MPALIFLFSIAFFALAYRFYGRKLAHWIGVSDENITPAHTHKDGVDYVPTSWLVLFGHHFSSIAGAGPIIGPILAAKMFGWSPALIWILLGAVFIGGVHDYLSHMASVRHKGRSIGEICRIYMSPLTYKSFLIFTWFALVYVLIVFLDLTAKTFTSSGEVATASTSYIVIAIAFGLCVKVFRMKFLTATLIFLPMIFLALVFGISNPMVIGGDAKTFWIIALLTYCAIASIAPVWILLQPRDYLSSYLLLACLVIGAGGLLIGGLSGEITAQYPMFVSLWGKTNTGPVFIFPMLFIMVACGAVSGFHSLVGSGTSSKQLDLESSGLPVAYGAMLVEGILAIIALAAVMITVKGDAVLGGTPNEIFANAMGRFSEFFGLSHETGMKFGLLAISTFLLTTLDTGTRLSRFIFEELFPVKKSWWRYVSTLASITLPAIVVFMNFSDGKGGFVPAWKIIWPVFGATNQLLGAMALLVVYVWLSSIGKKASYVLYPAIFMMITSVWALTEKLLSGGHWLIITTAAVLIILGLFVIADSIRVLLKKNEIMSATE